MNTIVLIALSGIILKYIIGKLKIVSGKKELQPVYIERVNSVRKFKNN